MSIIIRLYCVVTYIMAAPGPKYLLVCLPMYSIVALTPLIISIFIKKSVTEKYVIYYTTFIIDILFFVIIVFIQSRLYATLNMLSTGSGNTDKFPIFNKKNWIERFTLLTLLLIVIPVVFIPSYSFSITIHNIIYTIICGIIVISSGYIYNSVNSVLTINHALNLISPFFGCIWRLLHLPLHLGLTLIGVSLSIIVKNIYVYRNYPNNTFDETLSPKLPSSYYSGLEIFYTSDKFKSQSTSEEVHSRNNNINLGKAVHSIDEIKALLAVAFLLTFISVFLMKFLHRYTSSTIIDNSSNENNSYENIKKTNISASTKSINTNNSTENQNVIKSSIDFNNDEANGESNSKVTTNSETNIESAINNNMNRKNLLKMDSKASINSEQLKLRKENFYRLKKDSLKNSIMDLANNKSFANPKAQNIIDKCSNEKIANNISEMNNNAVITTYINSSLTIHSFFIFLFQISLILLFLIFNYIKIPVTVLLILTLIIVEIELLSEIFLPRILKITNKRKNIKILPAEKVNDLMRSESSLNNI
ncbi:hypothetical protein BCR36DRAFT_372200 [Piromyces finnis]|uniref:Uncharacterized protein n=1 Tax=Piromyces finnis TaxID=1754191 RepID=A0A1Y1V4P3_9FUNG|nr:hypothetical protein BCR36DRAFT_372200 [Piromyces finnis]|eukprot:ORX46373.1 hypothetical protein BCR36DRAFT_372200 [Piromyces finnis]